jgi:acyl-coenzyme A thioesterase PaaI-like protein
LARIIDPSCNGAAGGQGIVEGGVSASAIQEGMGSAGVKVRPDDLAQIVDIVCSGERPQGIIKGGVGAAAVEEAVRVVIPDDLA